MHTESTIQGLQAPTVLLVAHMMLVLKRLADTNCHCCHACLLIRVEVLAAVVVVVVSDELAGLRENR